jgi:hypothetical protein
MQFMFKKKQAKNLIFAPKIELSDPARNSFFSAVCPLAA